MTESVSLDIENNHIMIKGWQENSNFTTDDILNVYKHANIKGYVITDIKNDGMLKGLDTIFINNIVNKIEIQSDIKKSVIIAGGLTNYNDLENIKKMNLKNLEGIISGKSFYVGNIDLKRAQIILDTND